MSSDNQLRDAPTTGSPEQRAMESVRETQRLEADAKRRGGRATWGFELVLSIVLGTLLTVVVAWWAK
jgi:hypothetical protein